MLPIFHVSAFTLGPFSGNPAAVCLLSEERETDWMQNVAAEMNLSETAFVRPVGNQFEIRWFTPLVEVDLCGHATLAAAHVLFKEGLSSSEQLCFISRSGELLVRQVDGQIELNFPATPPAPSDQSDSLDIESMFGFRPNYVGQSRFDRVLIFDSAEEVRNCQPDLAKLAEHEVRGWIISARSDDSDYDIVSRFFAPGAGVNEDPVTGSAHCCLAPYWANLLKQNQLSAYQASKRGGRLDLTVEDDRVLLAGRATLVSKGELYV